MSEKVEQTTDTTTDTTTETTAESKLVKDLRKQLESKNEIIKNYTEKERVSNVWNYLTTELGVNNPKVKDILPKEITTEDTDTIKTWYESNKDVITFTVTTNSAEQETTTDSAGLTPNQVAILAGASNVNKVQNNVNESTPNSEKTKAGVEAILNDKTLTNAERQARVANYIRSLNK